MDLACEIELSRNCRLLLDNLQVDRCSAASPTDAAVGPGCATAQAGGRKHCQPDGRSLLCPCVGPADQHYIATIQTQNFRALLPESAAEIIFPRPEVPDPLLPTFSPGHVSRERISAGSPLRSMRTAQLPRCRPGEFKGALFFPGRWVHGLRGLRSPP